MEPRWLALTPVVSSIGDFPPHEQVLLFIALLWSSVKKKSSEKTQEWLLKFRNAWLSVRSVLPFIFKIVFCYHRFSGAVAIMLSGLKARGLKWSPFSVKRALAHTAQPIPNMCHYGQGNGLIQVTFITILTYEVLL